MNAVVSWFGNSFPGAQAWVQQDIAAMLVTADGTVYTNVFWDEAGREAAVYKDGQVMGRAKYTHGWGYYGGVAVAVNGKYVFIAQSVSNEDGGLVDPGTWPAKGKEWFGVSRRQRGDIAQPASFPGGKGGQGETPREAFLPINETAADVEAHISGLWASEERLYVSNAAADEIRIYDVGTMAFLTSWPIKHPGQLAMDTTGALWVLQHGEHPSLSRYTTDGVALPQRIAFAADIIPTAFCIDPLRQRLLVADNGPAQQIRIYAPLDAPEEVGTFGKKGGIYSGTRGAFADLKFNAPAAVGCDAAGNIYVAQSGCSGGGSTVLESYSARGELIWRLFGLEFVDMADVDAQADAEVFTKEEHFRMDYAKPVGTEWTYCGYTIDRFTYPEDPRLHISSAGAWVRRINNKRFLVVTEMNAEYLQVYRFSQESGEIAIPSGLFVLGHFADGNGWPKQQPDKGEWIWRDANGNGAFEKNEYTVNEGKDAPDAQGWWVDDEGTVWLATEVDGIRRFPCQGLDENGNPIWSYATMTVMPKPAEFDEVKRLRYDPATDAMYLGGTVGDDANQHWKPMGPVICRCDHWSTPARSLSWKMVAPYAKGSQGHESCEPMGFDIADDYLFVPYTGASREIGFSSGHIEVFRTSDGSAVGHMEPSAAIGEIGLQDIRECLTAHKRADGEYVIFLEEDWKAKILMYRWKP